MIDMCDLIGSVCKGFGFNGEPAKIDVLNDGLINTTEVVTFADGKKVTFQRINTLVFTKPVELMENVVKVTSFLRKRIAEQGGNPDRETLTFLATPEGKHHFVDTAGGFWRAYSFIDNSYTYRSIENREVFKEAGRAFGRFQSLLSDYPMEELHETIENFHNTAVRYESFEKAVAADRVGRVKEVTEEIAFVRARKQDTKKLVDMLNRGELPLRVTHNDTKLNNVLFDSNTHKAICVIDLDTIMPGLSLYDFGDAMRSGANATTEDNPDLSKVSVDVDLYRAFTEGYLESAADSLTKNEIDNLAFSAKLMTLECGMRFLTDYLDGDNYFKTEYPEHNLVRTRNQFKLVEDMEKHMDELKAVVR